MTSIASAQSFTFLSPFTETTCNLRTLLLPLAFDLLIFPLLLKTWRIQRVFRAATSATKSGITDDKMLLLLALLLVADMVLCVAWVLVDGPVPQRVYSQISPHMFEIYCIGGSASSWFVGIVLTGKACMMVWGLRLAWLGRAIVDEVNESAYSATPFRAFKL